MLTASHKLLPKPFDWVDIPAGKVILTEGGYIPKGGQTFDVAAFQIAKYPLTNTQFKLFVDAGGYRASRWWTKEGWRHRAAAKWTEPRYWQDAKLNGAAQPVVGVSWFEAIAFCQWLSANTGEKIMLPTEQQWQRAAQGDDDRIYPWGNQWDSARCRNSVNGRGSAGNTSPVTAFEGKGSSPFGVVDMAGNVWEWCLTDYEAGTNDNNSDVTDRVLRGGSWYDLNAGSFRCDDRVRYDPHDGYFDWGIRVSRFN